MKKVLIIGGLHGNERLGVEVVKRIQAEPIPGVTAVFGNHTAIEADVRSIESDLNRVFPGKVDGNAEERRAMELMELSRGYDVVLDFHNTPAPGNDCGFVGGTGYETYLPIAADLGLDKVVVSDYDCVNKYVQGCISVEICLTSPLYDVDEWVRRIRLLTTDSLPKHPPPTLFRYVRKVTRVEQKQYGFKDWYAFKPIPTEDVKALKLPPGDYQALFVNGTYIPENYAAVIAPL